MKVLVCGGRDYWNQDRVEEVLDSIHQAFPITKTIHGEALGADSLSGMWATNTGVPLKVYPAQWKLHGNAAGPKRNVKMLHESQPDLVVAFPGGNGTAHMVKIAKLNGYDVYTVD